MSWSHFFYPSTYFVCTSLFEGATDLETVFGKKEHDRALKENFYSAHSFRADKSVFDSKDFQRSCDEGHHIFYYFKWALVVRMG